MILMVILKILLLLSIVAIGLCGYIQWRNDDVYEFRLKIIRDFPLVNRREAKKLHDKYSYEDMLFSIKPLKLEAWFTEEEIKILKGGSHV